MNDLRDIGPRDMTAMCYGPEYENATKTIVKDCHECNGIGYRTYYAQSFCGEYDIERTVPCEYCNATGKVESR